MEQPKGDEPGEGPDEVPADPAAEATPAGVEGEPATASPAQPATEPEGEAETEVEPETVSGPEGSSLERSETEDPLDADQIAIDRTKVRKAPRFGRFVTIGVLLGLLVALVQTLIAEPDTIDAAGGPWASNGWGFFWLMSAIFVPIGVLLMCGIALLVDRRARRTK